MRVAARCDGRITLLLDHLGPAKGCLMQNPGLRDPTAGSETVQLATNSKLKSGGKKRVIFHVCLLHFPQQGGLQEEWATGAEETRIQT